MELRYLQSFCVVAAEGHVTRAAKRLNIAQPALSQQIRILEEELGVKLVRRVGRGIELTASGRYLEKEGRYILRYTRAMAGKAREVGGRAERLLTIAMADESAICESVTSLLREHRRRHPPLSLVHESISVDRIAAALHDGKIDAAISICPLPDHHGIMRFSLVAEVTVVAVPQAHPLSNESVVCLKQLEGLPLAIFFRGELPGRCEVTLRRQLSDHGLSSDQVTTTPHLMFALGIVASEAGCAIVPLSVVGLRSDVITYIPLALNTPDLIWSPILYTRRDEESPEVVSLLKTAHACFPNVEDALTHPMAAASAVWSEGYSGKAQSKPSALSTPQSPRRLGYAHRAT